MKGKRQRKVRSAHVKDLQLYGSLAMFPDTVMFRYQFLNGGNGDTSCAGGILTVSTNAGGQIDEARLEPFLKYYRENPPEKGETVSFEFCTELADETRRWFFCHLRSDYGKKGKRALGLIGKMDDISRQKEKEERLMIRSTRDGLTGVYNKTAFECMAEEALKGKDAGWLIMIDIDNFKKVNDTYGHRAGDKILVALGDLLREIFPEPDLIGRAGGDEFEVYTQGEDVRVRCEELLRVLPSHMPKEGSEVTVSIGIASPVNSENDYDFLFSRADQAMYVAKEKGKGRLLAYVDEKQPENIGQS